MDSLSRKKKKRQQYMNEAQFTTLIAAILLAGNIDAERDIPDIDVEVAMATARKLIKQEAQSRAAL